MTTTISGRVTDAPNELAPAQAHAPLSLAPVPDTAGAGSLRELLRDTMVYAGRNVQHIRQIPEKLLDVTLQPLMFVLLFAFVFGGAIAIEGGGATYREYLIGGILIQSLAFGLTGPATAIANDLLEGVIDRFRSLPASKAAYLLGHYVAELGGMAVAITVLLGTGLIVGWRQHTGPVYLIAGLALLLAFASAMIWIGTWIGLTVRSPDAVMGVGFIVVFPLTFISNAFVPIDSMPPVLQWLAAWNPVSTMVAAVRVLFGNPTAPVSEPTWPLENPVLASVIYCTVLLAVFIPLTLRRYKARTSD
jgi:ABC-2 type transport system permease protein